MKRNHACNAVQRSISEHQTGAAYAIAIGGFLSRLKNNPDASVRRRPVGKQSGGAKSAGGVHVMAACMHHLFVFRTIGNIVAFLNRQRIHVRPYRDGLCSFANINDHACLSDTGFWRQTEALQFLCNVCSCSCFLEAELRVGVDMAAVADDLRLDQAGALEELSWRGLNHCAHAFSLKNVMCSPISGAQAGGTGKVFYNA